ncbi:MAG: SPOR domain-containing protein [Candidatus Omnitrophica bacterium]|nr:SPOR domain-containing protein [Candidatus Omnitrophota bacterium]MDE2009921.1 SPOR domain-containing protein [Candidatus Omnitrophota bacterium]MDE2215009.1 SPOR domain-containing protein [Candidatus Omnitrophota bacterium]MDE2232181.1 SPOR domain-containing protein [Candidatus Omnitrophota bacterium]
MDKKDRFAALFLAAVCFVSAAGQAYAGMPDVAAAIMNKNYTAARDLASAIMNNSQDPAQRTEAQYYYGLAQLRLGQYAQARSAFQSVMDSRPSQDGYDKAALSLTEGFYMAGLYSDALDTATRLLRKSPHSSYLSLIYFKIAGADLKLMRWEEAHYYLNKILEDFPKSPEASIAKQLLEEKQYFAVQVGSFLDKGRALALIDDLKGDGQYAYVVETTSPDGHTYYRVRVGQMSSLNDAEDLKKDLEKLGYSTLIYP